MFHRRLKIKRVCRVVERTRHTGCETAFSQAEGLHSESAEWFEVGAHYAALRDSTSDRCRSCVRICTSVATCSTNDLAGQRVKIFEKTLRAAVSGTVARSLL